MKKYFRTPLIFPFRKIYFTVEEAASAIGIDTGVLSVYLSNPDLPKEMRPRTSYDGTVRLTDQQVGTLHKQLVAAKKDQVSLFEEERV